ncbi:quinone oxidoreductase [Colletotrichum asianum]|uniref:Dehydrogenase FUB6 n=1 Tax=Colletotrichum asianum TaxID=702518 RepID=A0A8H3WC00_9PEZI|nr:quinone oxidoreductase [Colletotrichum asianum]
MKSMGIAEVVESRGSDVPNVAIIEPQHDLPITHFLGALGLPGHTAYYALTQIVKAKKGEAIVISGAAGAVGTMAVQIAKKMIGCRKVIGIAGSDEKCRWVEKLGADICLNYKSEAFKQQLTKETEGFVEIYFDNVGGEILDFMLTRLTKFGRVVACGSISNYNRDGNAVGLKNYFEVIAMRLQITGFINLDWVEHLPEVRAILLDEWKKGTIVIDNESEMVVETAFEEIPRTWMMLYSGGNTGKLVTKLKY